MPIIRSSRVLYRWLLPVVFGAVKMEVDILFPYINDDARSKSHQIIIIMCSTQS
jgi:hypothetical protein